jgi:hypothetical protein
MGDTLVAVFDDNIGHVVLFDRRGAVIRTVRVPLAHLPRRGHAMAMADLGGETLLLTTPYGFGSAVPRGREGVCTLFGVSIDGETVDTLMEYRQDEFVYRSINPRLGELFPSRSLPSGAGPRVGLAASPSPTARPSTSC